jgi:hypothetical protein
MNIHPFMWFFWLHFHPKLSNGTLVLFLNKMNVMLCMCIHYSTLNNITMKNKYALPQINDLFDLIIGVGVCYFNQMDLKLGYYLICIVNVDVEKNSNED